MNSFQDRNGGVTTYAFSFPSIAVTDIKVTVDDVEQIYLTHYQVDSYSTTSGGTVNFQVGGAAATYKNAAGATVTGTPPATQDLNVRVYRQTKLINTSTGLAAPEADFTPGSSIRASDLDDNQSQVIYATQEERDQTITGPDIKDGIITNAKISNVAEIEVSKLKDGNARQILQTDAAGTGVEWADNLDVPGTLDVTGLTHFDNDISLINDKKILLGTSDNFSIYWKNSTLDAIIDSDNDIIYDSGSGHKFTKDGASVLTLWSSVADFKVHVRPWNTNTWDLGSSSYQWKDLYVDGTGYIDTVSADNITGSAVITSGVSTSDTKVYSAKRTEDLFLRQDNTETLASGVAWAANDSTVATTGAIDARIRGLITDVGGFRPIANESSFPTTNPDPDDNAGTIVSITALSANRTASAGSGPANSGILTTGFQTTAGTQVTINGCPNNQVFVEGYGILVETTATLNTYTFVRYLADTSSVATISTKATEIGLLGTAATVEDLGILGTADTVADMAILGTADVVSDMNTLAVTSVINNIASVANVSGSVDAIGSDLANNFANITDYGSITGAVSSTSGTSDITTVANSITNVNAVGPIAADVTTVAGNTTNITTCATNISAINGAATQATNAASSATAAASSATSAATSATTATTQATTATTQATTATTQATNAATSATNAAASATSAASSATTATAQANTATTQASNAGDSATLANTYKLDAKQYRDDASGIKTQSESSVYNLADNVSSHTAWGNVTDVGTTHFASESGNVLLTMSKGSSNYNYGSIT